MTYKFLNFALLFTCPLAAHLGDIQDSEHLKEDISIGVDIDQVQIIDNLIHIEEKKLQLHKSLKNQIIELKKYEDAFYKDPENKKAAHQLINTARDALSIILEMKIEHLFSQKFLQDLEFYSSIAGQQKPSRPD